MKQRITITLLLLACATLGFAQRTIDVDPFSEVSLRIAGTVYITQGSTQKVEIEGDEDDLEDIEIRVRGNDLVIGKKDKSSSWFNWSDNDDITVYITVPKLEGISVSSSGKVYGKNKLTSDELDLSVSGSGKMELEASNDNTSISVSGSGKIYIKGSTNTMRASISGSGKIRGEDFIVKECKATISGSGSCEVHVEEKIDARISGSGSVYYKGNPDKVNSSTSGSGRVKKM